MILTTKSELSHESEVERSPIPRPLVFIWLRLGTFPQKGSENMQRQSFCFFP